MIRELVSGHLGGQQARAKVENHRSTLPSSWIAGIVERATAVPETAKAICRYSDESSKITRQTAPRDARPGILEADSSKEDKQKDVLPHASRYASQRDMLCATGQQMHIT